MTEYEVKNAVKAGLQEFLLVLGMDVSTPTEIKEVQKDFAHLRALRLLGGTVRKQVVAALTSAAVTGIAAAVVYYVTHVHT